LRGAEYDVSDRKLQCHCEERSDDLIENIRFANARIGAYGLAISQREALMRRRRIIRGNKRIKNIEE
jgi:hypothetical protein